MRRKASDLVFGGIYSVIEWAIENFNAPDEFIKTASSKDLEGAGVLNANLFEGPLTKEGHAMIAKPRPRPEPEAKPPLKGGLEERLAKHKL